MIAQSGEVIRAEFLGRGIIVRWQSVLVRVLLGEVTDTTRLGWVEVKFEPLVSWAKVVYLKAPFTVVVFVAKLAEDP